MRKLGVVLGLIGILALAAPALAEVFVVGPGMLGHPADDPSVGYSSLRLDQEVVYADASSAPGAPVVADVPLPPWEEAWYQVSQRPGL